MDISVLDRARHCNAYGLGPRKPARNDGEQMVFRDAVLSTMEADAERGDALSNVRSTSLLSLFVPLFDYKWR